MGTPKAGRSLLLPEGWAILLTERALDSSDCLPMGQNRVQVGTMAAHTPETIGRGMVVNCWGADIGRVSVLLPERQGVPAIS